MNLSQDEINAMLAGGEGPDPDESTSSVNGENGLSSAGEAASEASAAPSGSSDGNFPTAAESGYALSPEEIDTLGEVGNICMGAVATTMYTLLDRRVSITTPHVSVHTTREVLSIYQVPFVVVEVEYTEGMSGKNLLLLKEPDAALITDALMGGDGNIEEPIELTELHMSAISEIMNQMIGAAATAMSKVIQSPVNISIPVSNRVAVDSDVSEMLDYSSIVIKTSFDMVIEGLLESQLLQLIPFDVGRDMAARLVEANRRNEEQAAVAAAAKAEAAAEAAAKAEAEAAASAAASTASTPPPMPPQPAAAPVEAAPPAYAYPQPAPATPGNLVDVRPMQFGSFDAPGTSPAPATGGMGLVYDIPLDVSVELGKTKKDISEILDFGMGTVIVLDKISGDPVEILVNGKLIARGEVVVIDENYGVRITDIFNN